MATWYNNDKLFIKYGTTEAEHAYGGGVQNYGDYHKEVFEVDLTKLTDIASGVVYLSDTSIIPAGAIVTKVTSTVIEASVGTNSNWNLGLRKVSDRTAYDDDGLVVAADGEHTAAVGTITEYTQGSTDHGALLGLVLANDSLIVAAYDTAAFTDGIYRIEIEWFTPIDDGT